MPAMLAAQVTGLPLSQSPAPQPSFRLGLRPSPAVRARSLAPRVAASAAAVSAKPAAEAPLVADRTVVRIGLPSKGRMAEQTLSLLKSCQLSVRQLNPRQYTADIPLIPNLEVWFQRPKDIVRKLQSGDLDLGIVGFDIVNMGRRLREPVLACSELRHVQSRAKWLLHGACDGRRVGAGFVRGPW